MKVNTKKLMKALGLMAAGSVLTMIELGRELTTGKHAQENRDFMRLCFDGYENGTLEMKNVGLGKVQASCMYKVGEVPDYADKL